MSAVQHTPEPLTPEQREIIKQAVAFTEANDRGDRLSARWESASEAERPSIAALNARADADYNRSKAALFRAVRRAAIAKVGGAS